MDRTVIEYYTIRFMEGNKSKRTNADPGHNFCIYVKIENINKVRKWLEYQYDARDIQITVGEIGFYYLTAAEEAELTEEAL